MKTLVVASSCLLSLACSHPVEPSVVDELRAQAKRQEVVWREAMRAQDLLKERVDELEQEVRSRKASALVDEVLQHLQSVDRAKAQLERLLALGTQRQELADGLARLEVVLTTLARSSHPTDLHQFVELFAEKLASGDPRDDPGVGPDSLHDILVRCESRIRDYGLRRALEGGGGYNARLEEVDADGWRRLQVLARGAQALFAALDEVDLRQVAAEIARMDDAGADSRVATRAYRSEVARRRLTK